MNLANAIVLFAFPYLAPESSYGASLSTTSLSFFVRVQFAGSIPDIYTRIIALTQTSSL
jgi:hypothetical protein